MADEIGQLVQYEFEGAKFVFTCGIELAQFLGRAIKALNGAAANNADRLADKALALPGEKKTLVDITKLSEGGNPTCLEIRNEDYKEVVKLAEEAGLHFWKAVDFDPNDNMTPILVPFQESNAYGALYKKVAERRLKADQESVRSYSDIMSEVKEKMNNASGDQKKDLEAEYENLRQSMNETDEWIKQNKDVLSKDDNSVVCSFEDYLKKAKGTDFEKSPEIAMAEYDKGVELGAEIPCKDCFQPIRSTGLVPETSKRFYVPETGVTIRREFAVDDKTGVVSSEYKFRSLNGENFVFSDKGITKDEWNEIVLPKMLVSAGLTEGMPCRVFDSQDKARNYKEYHGNVENPAKAVIAKKLAEGQSVFSDAEVKKEALDALSEMDKGFASAPVVNDSFVITIPKNDHRFINNNGKLEMRLSDTESIQFSHAGNIKDAGNGMISLTFSEKDQPTLIENKDGRSLRFPMSLQSAQDKMNEVLSVGGRAAAEAVSVMKGKGR